MATEFENTDTIHDFGNRQVNGVIRMGEEGIWRGRGGDNMCKGAKIRCWELEGNADQGKIFQMGDT